MSLAFALHLPHRRRHCPPAPPLPVRTGPVCHHILPPHHAASEDDIAAVKAERAAAVRAGNRDLVAALNMRLQPCDNQGPAEVTR